MKIKGGALAARQAFVTEHFGESGWTRVLAALAAEQRSALEAVYPTTWYPFTLGEAVDAAIVQVLGQGNRRVFEEIGAASADRNLTGAHRHFLAPGDPQGFMEKASLVYGFYYDTGRRTWEATGPSSGHLTTYDAETFSTTDCLTVIGWYRRALEMCGARKPEITEESCRARGAATCRYRVGWS
jgi:uncharacterized protein (TIGR02265 family)